MSFVLEVIEIMDEFFQLIERERANLVAGLAMQGQLDRTVPQLPRKRLTVERFHSQPGFLCEPSCPLWLKPWTHEACFTPYISSISSFKRAAINSRFSLPLAVSNPFSIENGSQ